MADNNYYELDNVPQVSSTSKSSSNHASSTKSTKQSRSSAKRSTTKDILVYIPDLPPNFPEDELEQMIETRVGATQRMKLIDVKCYSKLGVGVIRLINEDDKDHLVSNVESIVLDKKSGINISFTDEIDLESYIVFERHTSKIPSAKEVARRYAEVYETEELSSCESVSVQFPNIFRIMVNTITDLVKAAQSPDFRIEDTFAVVYPRFDCCFFEDLPSNLNDEKLSKAIVTQIGENELPPTSFYIQHNKSEGNAAILTSKTIEKWTMEGHLTINEQNITKKTKLAYRLVVTPVPSDADSDGILNHKLFAYRVTSHKRINNSLIIEIDNLETYQNCLEIGAFRIGANTMEIKPHIAVIDPNNSELDAYNWYETTMFDIKPDITTIIDNPQHPIFHYRWDPIIWIEQMKKATATASKSKKYDLERHLLRVTVMLNTIGVLRKGKYTVDDEEVILKCERLRTIGYDHQSKLFFGKKISEKELKIPYESTTVKVVYKDCLVLYEELIADGYRPVILNMANATSPGGGYRKGDGAQEENLFRRSNYYQSLDLELADKDQSEKVYCTPKGEIKSKTGYGGYYPMEEFGAIYTSGITVFRQTEADGYAYMKTPLRNVCAIAMAAYREPALNQKNMLENRPAINTHRKIENIFGIAYHNKHDCLVLSALGCGAFKNPPKHVALLFKSVIDQYAGYFKYIYFAIIDDHNAGKEINPHGNFLPFQKLLDGLVVKPPKLLRVNGVSGPYRILDKKSDEQLTLSDTCISYLPPCQHGSTCRDIKDAQHMKSFLHPPVCSRQTTLSPCDQINDEVHAFTFIHNSKCKHGGECTERDPKHLNEFDHPEECKEGNNCRNMQPDHLFAYQHLPLCRDGLQCSKYLRRESDHCTLYRHCKFICPDDNCCISFHDSTHFENAIHSFRKPCPFAPYNCSMYIEFVQSGGSGKKASGEIESHCLRYSHVCPFGRYCKTTDDRHYETSIHIARKECPDHDKCTKLTQEHHLESFSHPGIRDIRLHCKEPGFKCSERFEEGHLKKYRHGKNHNQLSVAPSSNYNSHINFVENQTRLISTVDDYVKAAHWKKAKVSKEILDWIRALQPIHRCAKVIFESILVHGHVMSRHYMKLLEKPHRVAKAVLQHSRIRLIFLKHNSPAIKDAASKLIKALVEAEFAKTGADGITELDPDHERDINIGKSTLQATLHNSDLGAIYDWTEKIAKASIALHSTPMGIGYDVDQKMGTDKHVFSILGPHTGHYYGDIVIIFKQEIMFHPDANFSIQAATRFHSETTYENRPWVKEPTNKEQPIKDFHGSKLHCSVPRYEYAAATELMALTGKDRKTMNVDLDAVIERWKTVDSHDVFEAHLPQLIPLDYIDRVYMPNIVFQSLTSEARQSARAVFKDRLIITDHNINLAKAPSSDDSRKPYLKYIIEHTLQKFEENMNKPHISRGIVITVPGSRFEEHIVLPMTISQSYDLYSTDNPKASNDPEFTYIYWQAMNGDMMLTISNQKIELGKDLSKLRCVICYVAEKPSTATEDYHEAYSYLNDGHPLKHYTNVHGATFKAKSNVFYRGCNTDDFFTFCLKLSHKTGEVTLSHAGPNSIYNHQKISYQFDRSTLDLSRINYIHVSGGQQDVPIRNLTINHEPVSELHPSGDDTFKIDTSGLLTNYQTSAENIPPTSYQGGARPNKGASEAYRPQSKPIQSSSSTGKLSIFGKIKKMLVPSSDVSSADDQSKYKSARAEASSSPSTNRSRAEASSSSSSTNRSSADNSSRAYQSRNTSQSASPPRTNSSKLPLCRDSVYCLHQNDKDHINKHSHLCRFNELCRKQADEPHLTHQQHKVRKCSDDEDCSKLTDPIHRAQYRHTGLPDYLFPCRNQDACYDRSSHHRTKFFHGEELPGIKKNKTVASAHSSTTTKTPLTKCRYGNDCRTRRDPQHTAKFSHPS